MDKNLTDSICDICKVLNKYSVEYLLVGGVAVALHGYFRVSISSTGLKAEKPDFDFWYNPTYKNYFNLLDAIEDLGQDVSEYKREIEPNPKKSFFKLETESFTLDFLPELPGLSKFKNSYAKKELVNIAGITIPFICLGDLLINKESTARPKDIDDLVHLKLKKKDR